MRINFILFFLFSIIVFSCEDEKDFQGKAVLVESRIVPGDLSYGITTIFKYEYFDNGLLKRRNSYYDNGVLKGYRDYEYEDDILSIVRDYNVFNTGIELSWVHTCTYENGLLKESVTDYPIGPRKDVYTYAWNNGRAVRIDQTYTEGKISPSISYSKYTYDEKGNATRVSTFMVNPETQQSQLISTSEKKYDDRPNPYFSKKSQLSLPESPNNLLQSVSESYSVKYRYTYNQYGFPERREDSEGKQTEYYIYEYYPDPNP